MYWIHKMHNTPIGVRFIVDSKDWSTKPLWISIVDTVSTISKMIFNTVESFHNKSFSYSSCKKFCVAQNSFPIVTKLNDISVNKKAKSISTFDFSTLFTTNQHKLLVKVLSGLSNFVFKFKVRKRLGFSKTSICRTSKGAGRRYFTKQTLRQC